MDPRRRYYFPVTGYNFRLTNIACALLCAQLERREQLLRRRREIYARYGTILSEVSGIGRQPNASWAVISPWLFSITVNAEEFGLTRDELMQRLSERGIETRPFFIPLHTLPPFREGSRRRGEELPVTVALAATGINLPTFSTMTDAEVERICDLIAQLQR